MLGPVGDRHEVVSCVKLIACAMIAFDALYASFTETAAFVIDAVSPVMPTSETLPDAFSATKLVASRASRAIGDCAFSSASPKVTPVIESPIAPGPVGLSAPTPKNADAPEAPISSAVAVPVPPSSVVTETVPSACRNAKLPVIEAKWSIERVSEPVTWSSPPVNARSTVGALVPAAVGIESFPAASCVKSTAVPVDAELT